MTVPAYPSLLRPVQDGEDVRQSVANRMPNQLADRTDHLKARLDALADGEAIVKRNVAISSDVEEGHAVYYDPTTQTYKPGLAATVFDTELQATVVAASAYVEGIIYNKVTAARGDLILFGSVAALDWTNAIGSSGQTAAAAGQYWLSGSAPGHITKMRPPVGVFVATLHGDINGSAAVQPTPRSVLEDHIHYAFNMYAQPAGTVACTTRDQLYEFVEADSDLPGWLPADDDIFNGQAPSGAKFGYNLSQHPELERVWPPLPIESAYLELDGVGVNAARYQIDNNTIWWFDNCYGKGPWPVEVLPCGSGSSSSSSSSSDGGGFTPSEKECVSDPNLALMGFNYSSPFDRRMQLYFVKMVMKTNTAVVTRLRAAEGSPILLTNCDGEEAETGDLNIDIDLSLGLTEDGTGYNVLKQIDGLNFKRGPVVEGLIAGSNVSLTPVSGAGETDEDGVVRGRATVNVTVPGSDQQELPVSVVALAGQAREEIVDDVFFLDFPSGKNSSFSGLIDVPDGLSISSPKMKLVFRLLARATGTLPALTLSYRRIPRNTAACTSLSLPDESTDLDNLDPSECGNVASGRYIERESGLFDVVAGDQILFTLGRLSTDTYAGSVGVLRQRALISAS